MHYDRFVALIKLAFPALVCLLKTFEGAVSEYLFIDATPMAVCHDLREKERLLPVGSLALNCILSLILTVK